MSPSSSSTTVEEVGLISSSKIKRQKIKNNNNPLVSQQQSDQPLIPGLPDHIAQICLSYVQNPSLLYSVSRPWRRLLYSPSFPPFLSLYAIFSSPNSATTDDQLLNPYPIQILTFDPLSSCWSDLPHPPQTPPLRPIFRHPSFISRYLPIQSVSASGQLILIAATDRTLLPALSSPLCFNPLSNSWTYGPPLETPRRWCATGVSSGVVYLASGMGSHFSNDVAKSVEKWDLKENETAYADSTISGRISSNWKWEQVKGLKDGRFCRDAIDAVGWRGKLCIGTTTKEGVIYDIKKDTWQDMPVGMAAGWGGPVAAIDEEVVYVVEEDNGVLRKYNPETDDWDDLIKSDMLKGARQITGGGGRICVICDEIGGGCGRIVVVDTVVVSKERVWVVETPPGLEIVAVHVLPRISWPDI